MTDDTTTPDPSDTEPEPATGTGAQVDEILSGVGAADALADLDRHADDGATARTASDEGEGGGRGPSQATRLVDLARREYRTVLGADGKTYAVPLGGPNLALSLRGENGLRTRLARAYYEETRSAPGASALADALSVLEGTAVDTEPEPVALRVARHGGNLVLDLGLPDGRCVVIAPGEWHVEPESPVLFRRTRLTSALPIPARVLGGLDLLRGLLNVSEPGFRLLVAWLVATLFPDIPHPILALSGEQGTAKSTTGRSLVCLLDPSPAPLRAAPKDMRAWTVQAAASWTVMLDNVSGIPAWFSDTLCKAVTGDGMVERALYTDDDVSVLSFQRVIGMTTIDAGALRGDLAERLLLVELEPIRPHQRRTDEQVKNAYENARPAILAAILDLTADVLVALPHVQVEELPRLADFAKILAAIDHVNGWTTFADFTILAAELTEAVIEADPFADAIRTLVQDRHVWSGSAAALAELVTPHDAPKSWPRTPRAIAGHLRRVAPALRKNGVEITFTREKNSRTIRLAHATGEPD